MSVEEIDNGETVPNPGQVKRIVVLLAGSTALMMTGFGVIIPVFPRRLAELGGGVGTLGLMTTAFMLAQFIFAPIKGNLADRYGRKPIILLSLASFAIINLGYLVAATLNSFILVRSVQGALTAGLFPTAVSMVGDIVEKDERARWIGVVSASYMGGFIFGPMLGGIFYDLWGFASPFLVSAFLAMLGFAAALLWVPETRSRETRERVRQEKLEIGSKGSFSESLPRPLIIFAILLMIDFVLVFAFSFVEPELVFYLYDDLGWTTTRFGVLIGSYGLMMAVGQAFLGPLSDKFSRKLVIIIGLLLSSVFYIGLVLITDFYWLLGVTIITGFGEALLMPALNALYMDITLESFRGRVMGLKEASAALGGVTGPLLVAWLSGRLETIVIFIIPFLLILFTGGIAILFLRRSIIDHKLDELPFVPKEMAG